MYLAVLGPSVVRRYIWLNLQAVVTSKKITGDDQESHSLPLASVLRTDQEN